VSGNATLTPTEIDWPPPTGAYVAPNRLRSVRKGVNTARQSSLALGGSQASPGALSINRNKVEHCPERHGLERGDRPIANAAVARI
jgi:hypothetical protein